MRSDTIGSRLRSTSLPAALFVGLQLIVAPAARAQVSLDSAQAVDSAARLNQAAEKAFREGTQVGRERARGLWSDAAGLFRQARDRARESGALDNVGKVDDELGRRDSALAYYGRALAIARELRDRSREAATLDHIGRVQDELGNRDKALGHYHDALDLQRGVRDRTGEGRTLNLIGEVQYEMGRSDSGLTYLRQALTIAREVGDRSGEGETVDNLGTVYGTLGRLDSALVYFRQALGIQRDMGDRALEGETLNNLGGVHSVLGHSDSALTYFRQALTVVRTVGDRTSEGRALRNIGYVHDGLGKPDSALEYYRAAHAIMRELNDRAEEAATLDVIGRVHNELGRQDSALVYFREALAITRAMGERAREATILVDIGLVDDELGQRDSALTYYREALPIMREVRHRAGEGVTLDNIGAVQSELGRPDSALAYYHLALAVKREVGYRAGEGATLNNIGVMQKALGRPDSALVYYRDALAIRQSIGDRSGEGTTLNNIGSTYGDIGQQDSALAYGRLALAIAREVGDLAGEGRALSNIGLADDELRHRDSALANDDRALAIERRVRDREAEGRTLGNIGRVHDELGNRDEALAYYREALVIARELGDRASEGRTLDHIAWVHQNDPSTPDFRIAVAYYDSAAAVRAAVGVRAGGEANRVSYAEQWVTSFERWSLAWIARTPELGPERSALGGLAASERGRSQALLDLMRGAPAEAAPGADLIAEGERLLTTARRGSTALISYLVTQDTILIWIASPHHGALHLVRTAVNTDSLALLVAQWRVALGADEAAARGRLLASRGALPLEQVAAVERGAVGTSRERRATAAATALATFLLPKELSPYLEGSRELVIVPQGSLALVPFAALPIDSTGALLGDRFAIRYTPSLASLAEAERRSRRNLTRSHRRQALVVGNPDMPTVTTAAGTNVTLDPLPGSATEGHWVASYLGSPFLTGAAATQVGVEARLPNAPLVHLATHGFAYSSESMVRQSWVALAPGGGRNGLLTVGEVLDNPSLSLSAELVVLSACQTGLGDLKKAEGTVGLQRAFLARGARSVLVSLWNVSDSATTVMMRAFYTHWLGDRDHPTKAEALRRAEGDVRAQRGFEAPIYWAGFQLVGAE
jgi:CHAT domain-containing protein/tetratricopeptide (TPR) repeat protein